MTPKFEAGTVPAVDWATGPCPRSPAALAARRVCVREIRSSPPSPGREASDHANGPAPGGPNPRPRQGVGDRGEDNTDRESSLLRPATPQHPIQLHLVLQAQQAGLDLGLAGGEQRAL